MKCTIHDADMEWLSNDAHPEGGVWFCEECYADEEAQFVENDAEYLAAYAQIMALYHDRPCPSCKCVL